jgi:proline iminopeptidase
VHELRHQDAPGRQLLRLRGLRQHERLQLTGGHAAERLVPLRDGTTLWTATTGSGPPMVFCHGGPGLWDYLGPLAALVDDRVTAIRFEQRGCARSKGGEGRFTIAQAVDDLEQLRAALGIDRWYVLGHSWGAELALRCAARHPDRTLAVLYLAGVGAGQGFYPDFAAEVRRRRTGTDHERWQELGARDRSPDEEHEWCLLQWRPDFSPAGNPTRHAEALWATRPKGIAVNRRAARELWADRETEDLLDLARTIHRPVAVLHGADDPRPWSATDDLLAALPDAHRVVLDGAGHSPWAERPDDTRAFVLATLDER